MPGGFNINPEEYTWVTFGGGGHSRQYLDKSKGGRLNRVGFRTRTLQKKKQLEWALVLSHLWANFRYRKKIFEVNGFTKVNGFGDWDIFLIKWSRKRDSQPDSTDHWTWEWKKKAIASSRTSQRICGGELHSFRACMVRWKKAQKTCAVICLERKQKNWKNPGFDWDVQKSSAEGKS